MNITFEQFSLEEKELLVDWLSSGTWPYHSNPKPSMEKIEEWVAEGMFTGEENRTFWIILDGGKVGMIRLYDLLDPTPMFDIRVLTSYHGKGIGKEGVLWLTDYIFKTFPDKIRIEGQTRQDNIAMRKVFRQCGYVKEAHYRKAWPSKDGTYFDAIGYGITREDWKQKRTTPVDWDDENFDGCDTVK